MIKHAMTSGPNRANKEWVYIYHEKWLKYTVTIGPSKANKEQVHIFGLGLRFSWFSKSRLYEGKGVYFQKTANKEWVNIFWQGLGFSW